ncbi:MAG TPA: DUF3180 domain-containing protein [Jatrophihabitans sp.]|nr:DUF3180 domain-containing protein [Jatrophihabitans sp.]
MNRRTRPSDLLIPLLVAGVMAYLLLQVAYESLPPFQWFIAVPVGALALIELVMANRVRGAIRHRDSARPLPALSVARSVALGKASALVGAALVGACAALALYVLPDARRTAAAGHDLRVALVVLVVSAALVATGLSLERAGIDPARRS